ncbi:unnamed protein product [Miscanthus lutarioriparius]|uniref:Uncharacterized protein n=1 Tax=Miscanthus lutarioriparius TaxID=422564 RepID=A0A811SKX6_9POAL|nr:unnamed protein product [Miscanthus lutarioriparius]
MPVVSFSRPLNQADLKGQLSRSCLQMTRMVQSDDKEDEKKNGNFRKHPRESKRAIIKDLSMDNLGGSSAELASRPQPQTFMFQSSTVTYGGPNGACYTSSTTRRTGADGITLEESKEADTTTGKASHRISRGIGSKGHSLARNLNSDGRVNTLQTLHNLNEDELAGFEESWQRKCQGEYAWLGS